MVQICANRMKTRRVLSAPSTRSSPSFPRGRNREPRTHDLRLESRPSVLMCAFRCGPPRGGLTVLRPHLLPFNLKHETALNASEERNSRNTSSVFSETTRLAERNADLLTCWHNQWGLEITGTFPCFRFFFFFILIDAMWSFHFLTTLETRHKNTLRN